MAITPNPINHLSLKVCNKEVQFVDFFTYWIPDHEWWLFLSWHYISHCQAWFCHVSLIKSTFSQQRISIISKINMYRALVVSVLLCSEAWSTILADRHGLDVFDMRSQRRIREHTKEPTASSLQRQRHIRWFVHLLRMPSSLPVRSWYDLIPNIHGWKRPRGRPKTRWADSIKHDLNSAGLNTTNTAQMIFDRPQWKASVSWLPTLEPKQGS